MTSQPSGTRVQPAPSGPATRPPRRIYAVGILDAAGLGMYLSFAAVYLSKAVRMSNYDVGLVLGAAGVASLIGAIPIGRLADQWGLRRSLVILLVARAVSYAGLALAANAASAVLAAALGGLLNRGISPLIQSALIAGRDSASSIAPLARLRAVRNAGLAVGALPTGVAVALGHEWAYRLIMAVAAGLFVLSAVVAWTLPARDCGRARALGRPGLVGNGPFLQVTALYGAQVLSAIMLGTGMALWITQRSHAPSWSVSMTYIINTVLVVVLQTRMSRGSDSPRRARHMMMAGGALSAAGAAAVPLSALGRGWVPVAAIVLVAVLLTGAEIYVVAGATSLALTHSPVQHRSTYLATFNLGFGVATVIGPTLISASLGLGTAGWLAWAAFFALMAAAARTVPVAPRTERREQA